MTAPLLLAVADGVATMSLNRPHRHNAIDDALQDAIVAAWSELAADDAVRVVVLRGEGPSFCSGRDTAELGRRLDGESDRAFIRRHQQSRLDQIHLGKPVIAALRGHVVGGGLEMALAADVRIAADDIRLSFPEVRYGLTVDTGGSLLATALAGPSRAKLMLMTGDPVGAAQALAWGLVDQVVDGAVLDATAAELAATIAAREPAAVQAGKRLVDGVMADALRAALDRELDEQVALFARREELT